MRVEGADDNAEPKEGEWGVTIVRYKGRGRSEEWGYTESEEVIY